VSHFRTQIYESTKALLQAECAAEIEGRGGILYGLIQSAHIYVEAHMVTLNTQAEATARLPLINLIQPAARRERGTQLTEFRGTTTLRVEMLVTGPDGETAAATRDALCDAVETALVASDVKLPDPYGERWTAIGWKLLGIDDAIGIREGALLVSVASLELELEIQDVKQAPAEASFGGLDVRLATRDPDDAAVEMTVAVDLEES